MRIEKFEDIIAWQKSEQLTEDVYRSFLSLRDFSFRDQIRRAAVSVMNNIAEGFERKGNKEFKKFLFISKGSCAEVRSMVHLAQRLGYLSESDGRYLTDNCLEISRIISALIKSLQS